MKALTLCVVLALTMLEAVAAHATEVYVVQGSAFGPALSVGGIEQIVWSTDAFFFNRGITDARVKLLGVSNGGRSRGREEFTIPPQRSASLQGSDPTWVPDLGLQPLWVLHLDVAPEVAVESLLFIGSTVFGPLERPYRFGKVRLPVFTSLIPAQQPQVHLGTYFGEMPSRINVAVYNAGSATASARIEIRQACDDTVVEDKVVSVPADTLVQFTGFAAKERECPPSGRPGVVYTVVTVDQPSFTFVSNLSNSELPLTSIAITATP